MVGLSFFKGKEYVGLDIGAESIKALSVKKASKGLKVVSYSLQHLPIEVLRGGLLRNPDSLYEYIDAVFKKGIPKKDIVVGLPKREILMKVIKYPKMDIEEAKQSFKWEFDRYFPFSVEEAVFDMVEVNLPVLNKEADKMEVMVVVAKRGVVEALLKLFDRIGLSIKALEPIFLGSYRAFLGINKKENKKGVVLLDIGQASTGLTFYYDDYILLTRTVMISGNSFTAAIQSEKRIGFKEAEEFKKSLKELTPDIKDVFLQAYDALSNEVNNSLRFVRSQYNFFELEKIFLLGQASKLPELKDYISDAVGVETDYLSLWDGWSVNTGNFNLDDIKWANAFGLAIRELV